MSKTLIANPPSHEKALALVGNANIHRKLQVTPAVRESIANAIVNHYTEMTSFLMGGLVTGSKLADGYELSKKLVEWEVESGSLVLQTALQSKDILLNDIVKRIPAELRKLGIAVEGWVCTGTLIEKIEPDLKTVNG